MTKKFLHKKLISAIILFAYLGVFAANVIHYHNYNFVISRSGIFNKSTTLKVTPHNFENCIVQSTFNSIHSSYFYSSKLEIVIDRVFSVSLLDIILPLKNFYLENQKLRSPPFQHSRTCILNELIK